MLMAATTGISLICATPAVARGPHLNEPAPDATLTLVNGQVVKLSDLKGQVVVLNFWATWCGPCKCELPLLDGYYIAQKRFGLRVFAVTTEDSVPERYLRGLFATMAIDPVHRMKGPYGALGALPTNYVIDRAGVVRYMVAGAFDLAALNRLIVPLLREPAPDKPAARPAVAIR